MHIRLGIGASQGVSIGPYTFPEADNFETDWTTLSLAAGWSLTGPAGAYLAAGTQVDTGETTFDASYSITPRNFTALTVITAYRVDDNAVATCSTLVDSTTTDVVGGYSQAISTGAIPVFDAAGFETLTPSPGMVVSAQTYFADGTTSRYVLTPEGYVGEYTFSDTARGIETVTDFNVSHSCGATTSSISLVHTYFGVDEELDLTAIKAIATGWGWTEAAYSATVLTWDSDWTTLALATDWTVESVDHTGTPVYGASGLHNSDTTDTDLVGITLDTGARYTDRYTVIMQVGVTAVSEHEYLLQFGTGLSGFAPKLVHYSDGTDSFIEFKYEDGTGIITDSFTPVANTGQHYIGFSVAATGVYSAYFMESGETTQTSTGTIFANANFPEVVAEALLELNETYASVAGTPDDTNVVNTYVKLDSALNQAAIEAVASGWGWTP